MSDDYFYRLANEGRIEPFSRPRPAPHQRFHKWHWSGDDSSGPTVCLHCKTEWEAGPEPDSTCYSRSFCEEFVTSITKHDNKDIVLFWTALAFGFRMWPTLRMMSVEMSHLKDQWESMSLWNKQGILYLLAPHISEIASLAARCEAQKARQFEPL